MSMTTILIVLLLLAFISGAPLYVIMLAGTALGAYASLRGFTVNFDGAINKMFGTSSRDEMNVLSTIPMFIYAGYLLAESKTADRLVRFANALLGWLPGGLAIVTIMTCALFTVFTGGSGVTIIALGGVLMPALVKNGYPKKFAMGLIAGTGSVGLLFPPAVPLFIYGTVYGLADPDSKVFDTGRFLFAGIIPGLFLISLLSAVAIFVAVKNKLPTQKFSWGELGRSFVIAIPELMIPFGVILLLISGEFGLPEIAALTVVYVTVLEVFVFRTLTLKMMWNISFEALAMIGALFAIIFASTAFTDLLINAQVPQKMVEWTQANVHSKIVFLLALNVMLLIVGTVMDIFSAIVVVLPLIAQIAKSYGIDPYHLGVIFLLNLEVGYLHPPVGINLFLTSVKFNRPITEVMWATLPFLGTMLLALVIITYVPAITLASVPAPAKLDPVNNLVELVEYGYDELKVSHPQITLVDATGAVLHDMRGQPVVRRYKDCASIEDVSTRTACQGLFYAVTNCQPKAKDADPAHAACANREIALWTVKNLNSDASMKPEDAVIAITELPMVDASGAPLTVDDDQDEDTPGKPIVDATGKPIVKKLTSCASLTGSDLETCRGIFVQASNCMILPPELRESSDESETEAAKPPPVLAPTGPDLEKRKVCIAEAIAGWVNDNPDLAMKE